MTTKNKRILLVLPEVFGCEGGIQMFCRSLCLAAGRWAHKNHATITAIVLNDTDQPDPRYIDDAYSDFIACGKRKARTISAYLKQTVVHQPDLIIFGHVSLSPLALIPTTGKARSAVITYGLEAWEAPSKIVSRALQKMDRVAAISEYTRNELIRNIALPSNRVVLLPCSLDPYWTPVLAQSPPELDSPVILTVCRLKKDDAYKGVDTVVSALPAVIEKCGPVSYRVVGQGDDIPRLERLARDLGVSEAVAFVGERSQTQLQQEYERCSFFVMPSEREGFGIVFLEAMAHSKAVIGGNHGGTPSVVKHEQTGLLVNKFDSDEVTRAIITLIQDHQLRSDLGRAGYQRLLDCFQFSSFETNFESLVSQSLTENSEKLANAPAAVRGATTLEQ